MGLELLIFHGADLNVSAPSNGVSRSLPPVLEAAHHYHGGIVLRLLQLQADPGTLNHVDNDQSTTSTLLHQATQFRHERDARTVIALLMKFENADINAIDAGRLTPLAWACASGRVSLVLWMILNGAK